MELLKINNQLCFPIYNASKIILKVYQPLLSKFGINYLQYLTLLILFEEREITLENLSKTLGEHGDVLKPLVIHMEKLEYVTLHKEGEEIIKILLSEFGSNLDSEISCVPRELLSKSKFSFARLHSLQMELSELIGNFLTDSDEIIGSGKSEDVSGSKA